MSNKSDDVFLEVHMPLPITIGFTDTATHREALTTASAIIGVLRSIHPTADTLEDVALPLLRSHKNATKQLSKAEVFTFLCGY